MLPLRRPRVIGAIRRTIETDARVALTTAQLQLAQWIYLERLRRQEAVQAETAKKPESSRWGSDYHSSRNR